jgi:hypothetical protein
MADNFNMKKYLAENKLGAYSRLKEVEEAKLTEDMGKDIEDAEAAKMMDFLAEKEKVEEAGQGTLMIIDRVEEIVNNLARNISTNSNIPTQEKLGLVQALKELKDLIEDLGADIEQEYEEKEADSFYDEDKPVSDYSRRRASELDETKEPVEEDMYDIDAQSFGGILKSDNPEGDALVLRFLKGIAKKFDYPVGQAALFVKERLKKLGY